MQFNQIHHCAVVVQDLERGAAFYRDVLGLREIAIPATFRPAGLEVRWFQIGVQHVHLLLGSEAAPPSRRHLAMQVDNARAARLLLQAKGIEVSETVPIPGADRFFIRDPDGNRIEIIEWKETSGAVSPPGGDSSG